MSRFNDNDPPDDPKLIGYLPLSYFRQGDRDRSSRMIRDGFSRPVKAISLVPEVMTFGAVDVDGQSAPQRAILLNTGVEDVTLQEINSVGDFIINTNCPAILRAGETCEIQVSFNPKRNGYASGGVSVKATGLVAQDFIRLEGVGENGQNVDPPNPPETDGPVARFTPTSRAFGEVTVGETSAAQTITLANPGDERLVITGITTTGEFSQTNNCGTGLAAGESCTITLRMAPATAGAKSGQLRVTHNGTGPASAALTGTAVSTPSPSLPVITVSDGVLREIEDGGGFSFSVTSLNLGDVISGESGTGTFAILGAATAAIDLISLPADDSMWAFLFGSASTGPFAPAETYTIPAGGRMFVRATFSGDIEGLNTRVAEFASADQTSSLTLRVTVEPEEVIPPEPTGITKRIRIAGNQFYEATDNVTDQGGTLPAEGGLRLASVNWFGGEGTNNTPHGTWLRPYRDILDQIKEVGFNCIRLPFSGTTIGATPPGTAIDLDLNPEFTDKSSLDIFDLIIDYCREIGLYVVLDHHRRSAGDGADGGPTDGSYTQAMWQATWITLANRYKDRVNVVGADIHNEPHYLSWAEWAPLCETVGNAIHAVAPDWIIFVEGVGHEGDDHYWWAGHLKGVATRPVVLTLPNRVAYSPHEYGQSVGSQQWLAYDGQTAPANWPLNLPAVWDAYWGFIHYENIAPIWIGEMGGHFGLDANTGVLNKPHGIHETTWMTNLVRYLNYDRNLDGTVSSGELPNPITKKGMSFAWWGWQPMSGDTGGLVQEDFTTLQTPKINIIQPLLDAI